MAIVTALVCYPCWGRHSALATNSCPLPVQPQNMRSARASGTEGKGLVPMHCPEASTSPSDVEWAESFFLEDLCFGCLGTVGHSYYQCTTCISKYINTPCLVANISAVQNVYNKTWNMSKTRPYTFEKSCETTKCMNVLWKCSEWENTVLTGCFTQHFVRHGDRLLFCVSHVDRLFFYTAFCHPCRQVVVLYSIWSAMLIRCCIFSVMLKGS